MPVFEPEYGCFINENKALFRIYSPNSRNVYLVIFDEYYDDFGKEYKMENTNLGDWEIELDSIGLGTYYGYRLEGTYNDSSIIIADPYSKSAVTQNNFRHIAKSLIVDNNFDWGNDSWSKVKMHDLIIYEAHLRDMTIDNTSEAKLKGTYKGFIERGQKSGVEHLKNLGVNAIQFLPLWDFANFEIPYQVDTAGFFNDWNPYERNHWGYMPTFFMAPESYYASEYSAEENSWNGQKGLAVKEMKQMVKELHRNGMAVILDVVINHVSNYDYHPLKYIDKSIYFKLNEDGSYKSQCCGNLLDTDNVKVREYIISSLKHWMINYHIDGFRFDQCYLLSSETATLIEEELKAINPNVYLYGEAWNERESEFSKLGWGSFNAYFRDVMRGDLHDTDIKGFLFGNYRPGENIDDIKSLLSGTTSGKTKTYSMSEHAINFLEVHDDYCFNDYIRFSLGLNKKSDIIDDPINHIKLNETQLKINKLGAMFLLLSKGVPIIHQGQEWGHSQIIASTSVVDNNVGKMDRNPYNKDNLTNWVNWNELSVNIELVNFYKNLIEVRKQFPALSSLNTDNIFFDVIDERVIGYFPGEGLAVFFNGHIDEKKEVALPPGNWKILLDEYNFNMAGFKTVDHKIVLPKLSGVILERVK
tara:strand:- start:1281 stop:3206 length:1926 start_codon:yes stop_codon:yes gene_type:complete